LKDKEFIRLTWALVGATDLNLGKVEGSLILFSFWLSTSFTLWVLRYLLLVSYHSKHIGISNIKYSLFDYLANYNIIK